MFRLEADPPELLGLPHIARLLGGDGHREVGDVERRLVVEVAPSRDADLADRRLAQAEDRYVEPRRLEESLHLEGVKVELGELAGVEAEQPTAGLCVEQSAVLGDDVPVALGLAVVLARAARRLFGR